MLAEAMHQQKAMPPSPYSLSKKLDLNPCPSGDVTQRPYYYFGFGKPPVSTRYLKNCLGKMEN
jgi:hypothetical protein